MPAPEVSIKEEFDDIPVVDISSVVSLSEQKMKSTQWAEIIDVSSPLENFNDLVPHPAFTWPFELDRFQKHVFILHFVYSLHKWLHYTVYRHRP